MEGSMKASDSLSIRDFPALASKQCKPNKVSVLLEGRWRLCLAAAQKVAEIADALPHPANFRMNLGAAFPPQSSRVI